METQTRREILYKGKVITVVKDDVLIDHQEASVREVVLHRGGCCIALKDPEDNKYFLVRQYRYAQSAEMLEFCAGKIEEGEDPSVTIAREAEEELGYRALNIRYHGFIAPTCGYSSEKIYLYSGIKGEYVGTCFDEDERIMPEKYSLEELNEMVKTGELFDGKTVALLFYLNVL